MDEKQAEELAAFLRSKEFRRDARRIIWPIALGLGAGPGNFAWACLAGILGFKLWDKVIAPDLQKDCDTFKAGGESRPSIDSCFARCARQKMASSDFWSRFRQSWNQSGGR